jgi:hypothetical protein
MSLVVVEAGFTISVSVDEVDGLKFPSPLYAAVTVAVTPKGIVMLACALPSSVAI